MAKPNLSFRPNPEDAEELRALAARADRTVSWIAANLISEALAARRAAKDERQRTAA
jgi:predicted transcriptional regulator